MKATTALRGLGGAALALALAAGAAASEYVGRPVFSEPGAGISLPAGCALDPSWRARLANTDLELWVVECGLQPHVWLLRRGVVEYERDNRARLRFQILDERQYPEETAGETVSVQCTARRDGGTGFAAVGATWRAVKGTLRLSGAKSALAVDRRAGKLIEVPVDSIDCTRFLDREETMRKLQGQERKKP